MPYDAPDEAYECYSKCGHLWRAYRDSDLLGDVPGLGPREEVVCTECGVYGERYTDSGEVVWPTT